MNDAETGLNHRQEAYPTVWQLCKFHVSLGAMTSLFYRLVVCFRCAALALLSLGAGTAIAETTTVFAAASLKTALDDVVQRYEAQTSGHVTVSYAGSSALARQVQQGAPADLVFLANSEWVDVLELDGLIAPGTRVDLLGNRLVVIAPQGQAPLDITDPDAWTSALEDGPLAMALVKAVPAGIYGQAALRHLGLWPLLAPRVAQTDNVRAALALVALREAPLGIVYDTDARAEPRVTIVARFPPDSHRPIRYPLAQVAGRDSQGAQAFWRYLQGNDARAVFDQHGFDVLTP